jgi:F-type H+-transporting ATPase subunit b
MSINLTLIGQMITFALLVWLTMRYVWPPIMKALHERQQKIADGLAAAEQGERSLEIARRQVDEMITTAKLEVAEILEQTNKRANAIIDEAYESAKKEVQHMRALAQSDIEQMMQKARVQLKSETADLALAIAERVIMRKMDRAANSDLIDNLVEEVGG